MKTLPHDAPIPWESVPVFPLPNAVLFPEQQMPLHIFEPRYRQMTRDVLERSPYLVVSRLLGDGNDPPGFASIASIGKVAAHQRLADGRFNLLLEGVARVRISEIASEQLYRRVRCTALEEPYGDEHSVSVVDISAMVLLVGQVMQKARSRSPELEFVLPENLPPAQLAFRVADRLIPDPGWRQRILETDSAHERVQLTTEGLANVLADLRSSGVNRLKM